MPVRNDTTSFALCLVALVSGSGRCAGSCQADTVIAKRSDTRVRDQPFLWRRSLSLSLSLLSRSFLSLSLSLTLSLSFHFSLALTGTYRHPSVVDRRLLFAFVQGQGRSTPQGGAADQLDDMPNPLINCVPLPFHAIKPGAQKMLTSPNLFGSITPP